MFLKRDGASAKAMLFLSMIIALSLLFPVSIIGSGGDGSGGEQEFKTVNMEDHLYGMVDLETELMEQYIVGEEVMEGTGYQIRSANMNGDRYDDLVLSAPGYNGSRGGVFIFFGGTRERVLELDDADVVIDSPYLGQYLGLDIAIGDVDGDGLNDLLVSGYADEYFQGMGNTEMYPEAYLFLGSSGWPSLIPATEADTIFIGSGPGIAFGWDIELGDITNDGREDIVISEVEHSWDHTSGAVYIWEGKVALQDVYNVTLGQYDHRIFTSDSQYDNGYGYWGVASSDLDLADINGDEYLDILIGSREINSNRMHSGEVEVIFGSYNLPKEMDLMTYSHLRVTSFEGFGLSHVSHADFNGDGIDDLIVNAPYGFFDGAGGVYIFYGKALFTTGDLSLVDNDFMIRGPSSNWGIGVQGIDDINGDGRDELILHSDRGIDNDNFGCYYMFYANLTDDIIGSVYNMQFEIPNTVIRGPAAGNGFGWYDLENLVIIDFDADGLSEVVVGDPMGQYEENPSSSGVVYFKYQIPSELRMVSFDITDVDGPDENVVGAGKVYHGYGHVVNTWDLNDLVTFDIKFVLHGGDAEGRELTYQWDRGLMVMEEKNDPWDYLEIVSSDFVPDGENGMEVFFNFTFSPFVPTEDPLDMIIDVTAGREMGLRLSYPSLFKIEPDVEFYGEINVTGGVNGWLNKGDYTQINEKITVTGLRVVYEDTADSPPDSYFKVQMKDSFGNLFLNSSSSGRNILFTYRTSDLAGKEEINITIRDLVGEAESKAGLVSFFYFVDTDLPEPPALVQVRADSDIDTLVGYDDDPDVYMTWATAEDETSDIIGYMYNTFDGGETDRGTFVSGTSTFIQGIEEGWNTFYIWSVDSAHNYGKSTTASVYYDVDMPDFGIPDPTSGSWINERTVNYEIIISDMGGSGVDGRSIEYSMSYDGGETFGSWEPTNIGREGEQITVKVFLNFREGEDNFVRWRAKDVSGNGYAESDPFQVKVDTIELSFRSPTPSEPVGESYISCGIILNDGTGSGVDARTIQYSISHDGVSNYGPWETMDMSGAYSNIEVSTPPIYFERDTLNYIRWRAKDLAGNGWTYSENIPIDVLPEKKNHAPVVIISSPEPFKKYLESTEITFDGSGSIDQDGDELSYLWYSDVDGYLGTDPVVKRMLSTDNHLITLHVSDGIVNESFSVEMTVVPDITTLDTDDDGIPDIVDEDDDNDGLLDIEEDLNANGLQDGNETDPKNPDTDGDGVNDAMDVAPRDPTIQYTEVEDTLPSWVLIVLVVAVVLALIVIAVIFILKQASDKKRMDARRSLRTTRRNVKRYEVLTGVPTNDLPAIEAVQWALPEVINEASEFVLEAPPSDDLLPPGEEEEGEEGEEAEKEEEDIKKPDLEDLEVPEPAAPPSPMDEGEPSPTDEGPEPPEPPKPEGEEGEKEGPAGAVKNCPLCGSEVVVPEGAESVECPLCGEIVNA